MKIVQAKTYHVCKKCFSDIYCGDYYYPQRHKKALCFGCGKASDNTSDKADRLNDGKPKLSMVLEASNALDGAARVLMFGANKYDRGNWRKGLNHTEICDSLLRHLTAYLSGEDNDQDSGLPHVDHIQCNALFLSEMYHTKRGVDDRSNKLQDKEC